MRTDHPWDWEEISRQCLHEARRATRGGPDAEDVAQEALLRAWRFRAHCHEPERRAAWVARICHNEARRRRPGYRESAIDPADIGGGADDAELVTSPERLSVRSALIELEDSDRMLLWLRYGWDLTQPDVAKVLGIPEGSAKVRLHRIRAALRDRLEDHGHYANQ
jgi:RNA polymerase sigma-70 factor (ECF subfamily)